MWRLVLTGLDVVGAISAFILATVQFYSRSKMSVRFRRVLGVVIIASVMVPAAKNMVDRWKVQPDDEDARIERIIRKATEEIEMSPERYRSLLSAIRPVDIFIPPQLATTEGGALQPQKNREALDMIVDLLKRFDKTKVTIEGYTDVDFNEAPVEQNLVLGERRAWEVSEYLMSKGIQRERITLISYGNGRPLAPGRGADARKLNNRIRLIFT